MIKTITWTGKTGKTATVKVELMTEYPTGHNNRMVPCCNMIITASVDGQYVGEGLHRLDGPMAGRCGRLGIPEEQMLQIEAVVAEFKGSPEWAAMVARIDRGEKLDAEYDAHYDLVTRAMDR